MSVLAGQRITPTAAGNRSSHALLQVRPQGVPGLVLVCDATLWSSAFGGLPSLRAFWHNLTQVPRS